jgi:hypothetical protein
MLLDRLVYVVHQPAGFGEHRDDLLVVRQVVVGEDAAFAVLEPLAERLLSGTTPLELMQTKLMTLTRWMRQTRQVTDKRRH